VCVPVCVHPVLYYKYYIVRRTGVYSTRENSGIHLHVRFANAFSNSITRISIYFNCHSFFCFFLLDASYFPLLIIPAVIAERNRCNLIYCADRLCKSLEEVHRAMALQDARKRRDRLALDCVRLGKIVSMRTVRRNVSFLDGWIALYVIYHTPLLMTQSKPDRSTLHRYFPISAHRIQIFKIFMLKHYFIVYYRRSTVP
jgi:hypothetical protein